MTWFYFKCICADGITRTESVQDLNYKSALSLATKLFDKFYPRHNFVNHMSKNDYYQFHNMIM